jgi:O-antigen ligase
MLRVVAAALVVGLLIKDLAYIGDRYIIRTIVEVTALLLALHWLGTRASLEALRRQVVPAVYLFVLLMTAFVSQYTIEVVFHVAALLAVILFATAYFWETEPQLAVSSILVPSLWAYALVLAACLAYGKLATGVAFVYEWGDPVPRFRGLFGEPAEMGIVAGLTLGLAVLVKTWWIVRIPAVPAAAICLYYTHSRTFWIGSLVAFAVVAWVYRPKWRTAMLSIGIPAALLLVISMNTLVTEHERLFRANSLANMSGRTEIWTVALESFRDRPILGYGFTFGSDPLMSAATLRAFTGKGESLDFPTLHNGYVQAALDSGLLGAVLYCVIVFGAVIQLWRNDRSKRYPAAMYVLVFSAVGNIGETYIFGSAQSHQTLFWLLAIFALGLDGQRERRPQTGPTEPRITRNALTHRAINWVR